jgi:hypothetical protein
MHFNIIDTQKGHSTSAGQGGDQCKTVSYHRRGTLRTPLLPLLTPTPLLCCSTATKTALPAILIPGVSWAQHGHQDSIASNTDPRRFLGTARPPRQHCQQY